VVIRYLLYFLIVAWLALAMVSTVDVDATAKLFAAMHLD
jgi:hypothetical protein